MVFEYKLFKWGENRTGIFPGFFLTNAKDPRLDINLGQRPWTYPPALPESSNAPESPASIMQATGLAGPFERLRLLEKAPEGAGKAGHVILAHLDRFSLRANDVRVDGDTKGGAEVALTHKSLLPYMDI